MVSASSRASYLRGAQILPATVGGFDVVIPHFFTLAERQPVFLHPWSEVFPHNELPAYFHSFSRCASGRSGRGYRACRRGVGSWRRGCSGRRAVVSGYMRRALLTLNGVRRAWSYRPASAENNANDDAGDDSTENEECNDVDDKSDSRSSAATTTNSVHRGTPVSMTTKPSHCLSGAARRITTSKTQQEKATKSVGNICEDLRARASFSWSRLHSQACGIPTHSVACWVSAGTAKRTDACLLALLDSRW